MEVGADHRDWIWFSPKILQMLTRTMKRKRGSWCWEAGADHRGDKPDMIPSNDSYFGDVDEDVDEDDGEDVDEDDEEKKAPGVGR